MKRSYLLSLWEICEACHVRHRKSAFSQYVRANEKAEIDFGEKGVKTLLLKFAKLEVLD